MDCKKNYFWEWCVPAEYFFSPATHSRVTVNEISGLRNGLSAKLQIVLGHRLSIHERY